MAYCIVARLSGRPRLSRRPRLVKQNVYPLNRRIVEVALSQTRESPRLSLTQEEMRIQIAGFKNRFVLYAPSVVGAGATGTAEHGPGGMSRVATAATGDAPQAPSGGGAGSCGQGQGTPTSGRRSTLVSVVSGVAAIGLVAMVLLARRGKSSAGPTAQLLAARL